MGRFEKYDVIMDINNSSELDIKACSVNPVLGYNKHAIISKSSLLAIFLPYQRVNRCDVHYR